MNRISNSIFMHWNKNLKNRCLFLGLPNTFQRWSGRRVGRGSVGIIPDMFLLWHVLESGKGHSCVFFFFLFSSPPCNITWILWFWHQNHSWATDQSHITSYAHLELPINNRSSWWKVEASQSPSPPPPLSSRHDDLLKLKWSSHLRKSC